MSKNFWEDAPLADKPAEKPVGNFWETAKPADVPAATDVDRVMLGQPVAPTSPLAAAFTQGEALGKPSQYPARIGKTVVKPAFDFTTGKTGAVHDAFTRAWEGETQADLIGELSANMAEQSRILSDPNYASAGSSVFNPATQPNRTAAAYSGMGGFNMVTPVRVPSPSERLATLKANRQEIVNKLRETNAVLAKAQGSTQGMEDFKKAEGWDALGTLAVNLGPILAQGAAESSVVSAKAAVAGAATAVAAGLSGGSSLVVQGAGLLGGGIAAGMESYDSKLMETLVEWGNKTGVDILNDPEGWYAAALKDPVNFEKVYADSQNLALKVGVAEGAATTALGGLGKLVPGGDKFLSKLLIGGAKGGVEEIGTLAATDLAEGKLSGLKDYALAGSLGVGLESISDAGVSGLGRLFTKDATVSPVAAPSAAAPAPQAAPTVDPATQTQAEQIVPGAGVVPAPAAAEAPGGKPLPDPLQLEVERRNLEVNLSAAQAASQAVAQELDAIIAEFGADSQQARDFNADKLMPLLRAESEAALALEAKAAEVTAANVAQDAARQAQAAPAPAAKPAAPAPAPTAPAAPAAQAAPAPAAPAATNIPQGNVEPRPQYDERFSNRGAEGLKEYTAAWQAWDAKYKDTHYSDGTPKTPTPAPAAPAQPAPAAPTPSAPAPVAAAADQPAPAAQPTAQQPAAKPTSSFVAGLREDAAKIRGQQPVQQPVQQTQAQPAAAPNVRNDAENTPPQSPQPAPAPAQAPAPQAAAQPAPQQQAAPSPQPTPAPGANRASFDPLADPRWENLYRDQQGEIRSLVAQRDKATFNRDRASRRGESTKQFEKRLNNINNQIESILAQSQPRPDPVARPDRPQPAPAAAAAPVEPDAPKPEPEAITKAKAEAVQIKEQITKLEASGQGRSPQATKLRNRFNLRKADITSYERKNGLPITYPPQPRPKAQPAAQTDAPTDVGATATDTTTAPAAQVEDTQAPAVADTPTAPAQQTTTTEQQDPDIAGMPSDAEVDQELARIEAEKTAREEAAAAAQAEEPAHVASFREGYDILRDDLEGAAQEQATADKLVNGKNGIVTRADALLEGAADMDPKEFAKQARALADSAESLADDQQEKSDNIENAGREDTFDGRGSMIDGLNDLATNLREAADKADPQATTEAKPAPTVNPQQTMEAQLARIDKQLDSGIITQEQHAEVKGMILAKFGQSVAPEGTVAIDPGIASVVEADVEASDGKPSQLELWADNTLKQARKNFNSGLDPVALTAAAVKVAYWSARGIKKVGEMTAKLISEYGEAIRPHIKDIIAKAKDPNLKAQALETIEAQRPTGPLSPKEADAARRSLKPIKVKSFEFSYTFKETKTSKKTGKTKVVTTSKVVYVSGDNMTDARRNAVAKIDAKMEGNPYKLGKGSFSGVFDAYQVEEGVFVSEDLPNVVKTPKNPLAWRRLFFAAGRAAEHALSTPDMGLGPLTWAECMAILKHGSSGQVPPNPAQLLKWLQDGKLLRSFVEEALAKNPQLIKSAIEGLASLDAAHKASREGRIHPKMVAAHMAWGLMSRMLDPYNQEAGWIRVFSKPEALQAIEASVNGEYSLTEEQWNALVSDAMIANKGESVAGRGATSNANAFHLMLSKWNGKWDKLTEVMNGQSDAVGRRQAFFEGGFAGAGIKHKVLSFVLATLAEMGVVVIDRWQVVNFWMPHLELAAEARSKQGGSAEVFTFDKNGVPEDTTGAYDTIGGMLNDNAIAEGSYQIIEQALRKIAEDNKSWLNPIMGKGPNETVTPFEMHWLLWNIIKQEPVGHSSLDSTTQALENNLYEEPDFANKFAALEKRTEKFLGDGQFEVFTGAGGRRPTVSTRGGNVDGGGNGAGLQENAGRGQDGPVGQVDRPVLTKDGDVANHGDADLARRGFITNKAASIVNDAAGEGSTIEFKQLNQEYDGDSFKLTIKDSDGNYIGHIEVEKQGNGEAFVVNTQVKDASRGKRLSNVLYAEAGEHLIRDGVTKLGGKVIDQEQRPIRTRESTFGKGNTKITEEDRFTSEQTGGSPETHRWVETKLPEYTPEQRQLLADIKKLQQDGNASPEAIAEKLDEWAKQTLDPKKLLTISPQVVAAMIWNTARDIQKAAITFGNWSKNMVQTYGPKIKPFLKQIWADSKAIRQNAFDIATVRYLASRADKVWQNVSRNPQSPTLRKLANLLHTVDGAEATGEISSVPQRIREERIKFSNAWAKMLEPFAAEFSKMTKDQRQQWDADFRDYVLGNKKPTDPKVAKAVAQYRQMMGELLAFQRAAGVEMGDRGGNYYPRVYSPEAIEADPQGFIDAAAEMYRRRDERLGEPAKTDEEYQALASQWAFRIQNGNVDDIQLNSSAVPEQSEMPSSTKPREFTDEEAELAAAYLSKDIDRVTLAYIGRATKAAEVARAFGPKGEKFTQMIAQLQKEGVDLSTTTETAGLVRRTLGYGVERHSKLAASVIDWSNAIVAAGYLGFSFINNILLEPISYGIRTGNPYLGLKAMADTWIGTVRSLSRPSAGMNARIEKAFGTRVGMAKSFNEAMAEQLGLLQSEMERSFLDAHWNYTEENGSPLARWIIQRTQQANLMQQTEHAKVAASVGIARLAIRDNVRFMMGQAPLQKFFQKLGMDVTAPGSSKIILNENGVPEAEHKAFAEFVMGLEGKSDAEYQKAIMANDRMAFLYRQAVQRMSTGMSIKSNPALKIDSSDKVEGKFLMQLMNYSYAYANLVKDAMYSKAKAAATGSRDQITMLDRARLAVPLLVGAPLSIIAAEAGKQLVGALWPTEGTEKRDEMEDWRKLFDSASYAGIFGPKVEYLAKLVNRGQLPVGPGLEAAGKTLAAVGGLTQDGEAGERAAKKQIYNAGIKPAAVGGASAVHPFLGFMVNQAMRQDSVRDEFIGEK